MSFSDESKFNLFGSDGRRTIWRHRNEALKKLNVLGKSICTSCFYDGSFLGTLPWSPSEFRAYLIVLLVTSTPDVDWTMAASSRELIKGFLRACFLIFLFSLGVNFFGRPLRSLFSVEPRSSYLFMTYLTVAKFNPKKSAIWRYVFC